MKKKKMAVNKTKSFLIKKKEKKIKLHSSKSKKLLSLLKFK